MVLKENEKAAAGYILTLFSDIENLTHHAAGYCNVITEIKEKYPGDDNLKKMDDAERVGLQEAIKYSRYWCIRTFIKFSALAPNIPAFQTEIKQIEKLKIPITSQAVPQYADFEKYVLAVNALFVKGIASDLLTKAQDVYNQMQG